MSTKTITIHGYKCPECGFERKEGDPALTTVGKPSDGFTNEGTLPLTVPVDDFRSKNHACGICYLRAGVEVSLLFDIRPTPTPDKEGR